MSGQFWKRAAAGFVPTTIALCVSLWIAPAAAGGGVGFTFGFSSAPAPYHSYYHPRPAPYYAPPPVYYRGPVYAPPPVYVTPPPVYYAPPVYVEPAPIYAAPPYPPAQTPRGNCREYQSTAIINGVAAPTFGTACQQPDGTWRLIN